MWSKEKIEELMVKTQKEIDKQCEIQSVCIKKLNEIEEKEKETMLEKYYDMISEDRVCPVCGGMIDRFLKGGDVDCRTISEAHCWQCDRDFLLVMDWDGCRIKVYNTPKTDRPVEKIITERSKDWEEPSDYEKGVMPPVKAPTFPAPPSMMPTFPAPPKKEKGGENE